jgi:hypothetical protein
MSQQLPCARRHNHGFWIGECLQAGSEIWSVTDKALIERATLPYDDQTGRNSDPDLEVKAVLRLNFADCLDHGEAGTYGTLGIVLMGRWVAEGRKHPVSQEARDNTTVAADRLRTSVLIFAQKLLQVFWIQLNGQSSGADEITEEQRKLASLNG